MPDSTEHTFGARRPKGHWPEWIDDLWRTGPLAELEDAWKAEIGDAITRVLDQRNGNVEVTL